MTLSKAAEKIEAWLDYKTYEYEITEVQMGGEGEYRFYISEYTPSGEYRSYFMTVETNGDIINDNGENVVKISANSEEDAEWLKEFVEKFSSR